MVSLRLGPTLVVTGHVDATGMVPIFGDQPSVIEIKTGGPEAYKRWRTLGAERSNPESVAQAAFYSYGTFGEARDVVIATMDTAARQWDFEVIPADRVAEAFHRACERLGIAGRPPRLERAGLLGPAGTGLHRRRLAVQTLPLPQHLPTGFGGAWNRKTSLMRRSEPVTDEEAQAALHEYENAQEMLKAIEEDKAVGAGGCFGTGSGSRGRTRRSWRAARRPAPWGW